MSLKTPDDELVEDINDFYCARMRHSFWEYRRALAPDMLIGWWQRQVARELQQFWKDFQAGKRPKLIIQSPRQHGKSRQITEFISWITGHDPNLKVIFASFSEDLGRRANLTLQRIYNNPRYRAIFTKTRIASASLQTDRRQTQNFFEFVEKEGFFRNTTVKGPIVGQGMDLGVLDDPIKGSDAAHSQLERDRVWRWMTDDFMPCFSKKAGFLMIMTRWHVDDPAGRLTELLGEEVKSLRYPALAEHDEEHRKEGEPLFPEHKPLDLLMQLKRDMTQGGWSAEYQQTPIVIGGGIFPIAKFQKIGHAPARQEMKGLVRYWDKAGTTGGGAYTAGVLMAELRDGTFVVLDVRRGQWAAYERENMIKQAAKIDRQQWGNVLVFVEQEPGSGGKESADQTVRNLAGYQIYKDRVRGSKEERADPYAAQVQGGNVLLLNNQTWDVKAFVDEHEQFPNGKYVDQVDAAGGAFNKLVSNRFRTTESVGLPVTYQGNQRIDPHASEQRRNAPSGIRYVSTSGTGR